MRSSTSSGARETPPAPEGNDEDAFLSSELEEVWQFLSIEERVEGFRILTRSDAEDLFDRLIASDQARLILALPQADRRKAVARPGRFKALLFCSATAAEPKIRPTVRPGRTRRPSIWGKTWLRKS